MTPEQVAASYDQIASQWDSAEFPRTNGIAQHERALRFVSKKGIALDVGCGSSGRIIDLLLAKGFQVEGIDISTEMLRLAQARHPQVQFHQADIYQWTPPRTYDFISAWDSIWHVPLASQLAVIQKLCHALTPGGVFLFSTGGVEQPDERTNSAMGVPMYHAAPGIPHILQMLQHSGYTCRHLEYDQYPESHVYVIAQNLDKDCIPPANLTS